MTEAKDINKEIEELKFKKEKERMDKMLNLIDMVFKENEASLGEALNILNGLISIYQRKASKEFKIK